MLADTPYDVVVLDVTARFGRVRTCRRLRSAGDWTPIIMLTPRAAIDDRIRGLTQGPTTTSPSHSPSANCSLGCVLWRGATPLSGR